MEIFNLPINTKVNRVVPKNTFDTYTNTKQKKLFVDKVSRITWTHKLSNKTTNLKTIEVSEIQVFKIELKVFEEIPQILEIIDRAIPSPIIFSIQFEDQVYFATSSKHPHPTNPDNTIIDWLFKSKWGLITKTSYSLNLKISLDHVHKDFILQLTGKTEDSSRSIQEIVECHQKKHGLEKEIEQLKLQIKRSRQYKKKVELNLQLKDKEKALKQFKHESKKTPH